MNSHTLNKLMRFYIINGNYEDEFNSTGLPSGVYFYQIKVGDFVQTKKMVLMK